MGIKTLSTLNPVGRVALSADKSLYVATFGSDSNSGETPETPFLTIQKAIDVACSLDLSIYKTTINIADGFYKT